MPREYKFTKNTYSKDVVENPARRIDVEIGDSKQDAFYPQFKLKNWDNETNFSLRYIDDLSGVVEKIGDTIKYIKEKEEVHFYEKPNFDELGGFEIEILLKEKPASNKIRFSIQSKGLNFFYQPELTQKEKDNGGGRPDNVIGSYAVYHKTKRDNIVGQNEYRTGKAFHIYRPKIIDKNGNWIWGELNIDEQTGILTITIDQQWLDGAIYPVLVDPTFGYTTVGSSWLNLAENTLDRSKRRGDTSTSPGDVNTVEKITVNLLKTITEEGVDVTCFLSEEDSGGVASHGEIVKVERTSLALTNSAAWYDFTAADEGIVASTEYIINACANGLDLSDGAVRFHSDSVSDHNGYTQNINGGYTTLRDEDPWTQSLFFGGTINSIYLTYTLPGYKDDITITEFVDVAIDNERDINVSDLITISENPLDAININIPNFTASVNVNDLITATENVEMRSENFLSVSDLVTASESTSFNIVTADIDIPLDVDVPGVRIYTP